MSRFIGLGLLALLATPALAQDSGFDGHGFTPVASDRDLEDLVLTWRPERQVVGSVGLQGLFEFAKAPLVLLEDKEGVVERIPLLDNVFAMNLGGHVGIHERVGLGLSMPLFFASLGEAGRNPVGIGDLRVSIPVGIVLPDGDAGGFALGVVPHLVVPTGADTRYFGSRSVGAGGAVAASYGLGPVTFQGNLGLDVGPPVGFENVNGGARLTTAVGVTYRATDYMAVGLEHRFDPTLTPNRVVMSESPGELVGSLRGRYASGLHWTGGASVGTTRGASAAVFRIFAGAGWTFGKHGVEADTDGDGFVDSEDRCPQDAETFNGYLDDDGCPDALATVRHQVRDPVGNPLPGVAVRVDGISFGVTDADGTVVIPDRMPESALRIEVEPAPGTGMAPHATELTPRAGEQQSLAVLGWLPGAVKVVTRSVDGVIGDATVSFRGPTEQADAPVGEDGEEIVVLAPGAWTLLVSAPAFGTERRDLTIAPEQTSLVVVEVTLLPPVVEVTKEEVLILEQILFEFDSATIRPESRKLVEQIASTLTLNPQLKRVEVQGHTDSVGRPAYNLELSQRRVESVVDALVAQGVARERLTAKGYGQSQPIADNATEEGRSQNRRVQFIIVDPAPTSE